MNRFAAALGAAFFLGTAIPALASSYVQDGAGMFSSAAIGSVDQKETAFTAQTGKSVVVETVPSLPNGETVDQAARQAFSSQGINGTLIYVARDDRKIYVLPGQRESNAGWFSGDSDSTIANQIGAQFKQGNYDAGLTTGVDAVLNVYRAHLNSLPQNASNAANATSGSAYPQYGSSGGFHFSMFTWVIIFIVGWLVLRSLMRAMSGPRYYSGPPQAGGSGYGPGYYGGGGGGFWSGLVGGLGGAWLGNELFGGRGGGGALGGGSDYGGGQAPDPGGWGSDAGQSGSGGGADWSGGGFGGGGDFGGGGFGGDGGGGGGDGGGGGW